MPAQTLAQTRNVQNLPHLTVNSPKVSGKIRQRPEDFQVDEVAAYAPEGSGTHLFVHFRKIGIDTPVAVGRIADALGVPRNKAGWAGLKDRHAVTTQWASFEGGTPDRALGLQLEGVEVLTAALHGHKLRTGHLRGNRFRLVVRGCPPAASSILQASAAEIIEKGLPNFYGEQRFGRDGRNLERALQWIVGGARPPRDRFERKLHVSTLQSALFNDWLAERMDRGAFGHVVHGDLVRKEDTGGLFIAADQADAQHRHDRWELSTTGPIFGPTMRWPEHESLQPELDTLTRAGLSPSTFSRLKHEGPGSRRPARVRVADLHMSQDSDELVLTFTLPAGSYATVLLREFLEEPRTDLPARETAALFGDTSSSAAG